MRRDDALGFIFGYNKSQHSVGKSVFQRSIHCVRHNAPVCHLATRSEHCCINSAAPLYSGKLIVRFNRLRLEKINAILGRFSPTQTNTKIEGFHCPIKPMQPVNKSCHLHSWLWIVPLCCAMIFLACRDSKPTKLTDPQKSANDLSVQAEAGNATAQFELGNKYSNATGPQKNLAKALDWFRKAALQDHVEAQFKLAVMYQNGEGVKKDATEAVKWYDLAGDQGHVEAQFLIGKLLLLGGDGVQPNGPAAANWFRKAAEKNITQRRTVWV